MKEKRIKLNFVFLEDPDKGLIRPDGTKDLFINRRTLTDVVKLYDEPHWWKWTSISKSKPDVGCSPIAEGKNRALQVFIAKIIGFGT